jgi:transcriptional regulator with XRE-family HTH domain
MDSLIGSREWARAFGQRLLAMRQAEGLTQAELARESGLSSTMISKIERGQSRSPSLRVLLALAAALRVNPDEILTETVRRPRPSDRPRRTSARRGRDPQIAVRDRSFRTLTFEARGSIDLPAAEGRVRLTLVGQGNYGITPSGSRLPGITPIGVTIRADTITLGEAK